MKSLNLRESLRWNERTATWTTHVIVSLMMFCVGISVAQFGSRLFPVWDGRYLPLLSVLVAIEALYTNRRVNNYAVFSWDRIIYRSSELVVLLLVLKVFFYVLSGFDQLLIDQSLWRQDFFKTFFAGEFGVIWIILMLIWVISGIFSRDLLALEGDEEFLQSEINPAFFTDRTTVRRQLAGSIFVVGGVMIFLTTLTRVDLKILWGELPPLGASTLNVLAYFLLGMILLSLGQFAILRASWGWQRIPIDKGLAISWIKYSVMFLVLLTVLVSFLPTGYSLGLLETMGYVFKLIQSYIILLAFLPFLPILLLISALPGVGVPIRPVNPPAFSPPPFLNLATADNPIPLVEVVKSLLFWIVFLGIAGYSIAQYLKQNKELMEKLRQIPGWAWLAAIWQRLVSWLGGVNQFVSESVYSGLKRLRERAILTNARSLWRIVHVNQLSAREQVLFFYLSMVRRGKDHGNPRLPSQTPAEYGDFLKGEMPEIKSEIRVLTDAFVKARYSQQEITLSQADAIKESWQHILRMFRRNR